MTIKTIAATTAIVATSASTAFAGGIDRHALGTSILFEDGNYAQISIAHAMPDVTGTYAPGLGGGTTANMALDYSTVGVGLKFNVSKKLSAAFIFDQPYGANASYISGPYTGLAAEWESNAMTFLAKYQATEQFSIYGGPRILRSSAEIAIPSALFQGGYTANGSGDTGIGYVIGGAYEKKDIALRVGLTYQSKIDHEFSTTETTAFGPASTTTNVEMPQSLALDFQSGVAANTLVFGSIKWTEWSVWSVSPPLFFGAAGVPVVSFDNDTITLALGVGRKINDKLALFGRIGYEEKKGGISSRLSPTDGRQSIGIGANYKIGNTKITGGLEYVKLGDAVDGSGTNFNGNSAVGLGLSIGHSF